MTSAEENWLPQEKHHPLTALITVNSKEAYTLFDTGNNTDAVSNQFAAVTQLPVFELDKPIGLQLGVKGSCSTISYGTRASLSQGGWQTQDHYLDVANLDKYDLILGIPFMTRENVLLSVRERKITIGGHTVTLKEPVKDTTRGHSEWTRVSQPLKAADPIRPPTKEQDRSRADTRPTERNTSRPRGKVIISRRGGSVDLAALQARTSMQGNRQ